MLFERGSAVLSDQTKLELDQVAEMIRGHRNIVMIKGHTSLDDLPDDATEQQKMDLSLRRAQAAADYLVQKGSRSASHSRPGLFHLRTAHGTRIHY